MYGWRILGCGTLCGLLELWRCISNSNHDQDHETEDNKTLEKHLLRESSCSTASGRNSRSNNKDSEYGNKSTKGTHKSFARFQDSRTSPPSFSNIPSSAKPASASSTSLLSATEPPPWPSSTSSSFSKPSIPSSKPASPLPKYASSAFSQPLSSPQPPQFTSDRPQSSAKPPASLSFSNSSPSMPTPSSPNSLPSSKPASDSISQSDRTIIYYYEYYPNLGTTKIPGAVSPQSEYGNKSTEGTNESFARFKYSRTSPPSFSNNPSPYSPKLPESKPSFAKPSSASSTSFLSATEPPPSSSSTSSSFSKPVSPLPKYAPSSFIQSSFSHELPSFTSDQPRSSTKPPASPSVPTLSSPEAVPSFKPTLSPLHSDSTNQQGFAKPASASSTSFLSATEPPPSSSSTSSSFSKPASPLPKYAPSSSIQSSFSHEPLSFTSCQCRSSTKPPASPSVPTLSSPEALPSSKPTLFPLHSDSTNQQGKANYMWVQKGTSPSYMIPKDIENMFKKGIVPDVLKKPLSPSTYKDYFAALLYAEDFYIEKWSNFQLYNVTLVLHEAAIYDKSLKNKNQEGSAKKDDKNFVTFEIDSVPERPPFLLSRAFVYAQRAGFIAKRFQGIIYRVMKSNTVLVEFEKEFYSQHRADCKYDISFSFNRACLKRAHQAIAVASDPLFQDYLFPDCASEKNIPSSAPCLYSDAADCQGQLPYLIEGPLCVIEDKLSKTGLVVKEVVLKVYKKASKSRILICALINSTCDVLVGSLKKEIPELNMFRVNAAFREMGEVPDDILPLCVQEGECFSCPSLQELRQFRVIFSTFASSFRLHNKGITAGHFSQIFLLDASSATEPEVMIALSNLANENTTVIVTGAPNNHPRWVRSDIARRNGLRKSYFERLRATKTYSSSNPKFFKQL